jgi:hypothetical protein
MAELRETGNFDLVNFWNANNKIAAAQNSAVWWQ